MAAPRWLEMTWRDGLFCHWAVDPAVVEETLPPGLSVAAYDGDAYLGVVAFVMDDIRPRGSPIGLSFPELNLRTYVEGPAGPGVYFYNLDADDRLGVAVARRLFALPYYLAEMTARRDGETIRFTSRRVHRDAPPARFDATYGPTGDAYVPDPDSRDAFLVENYRFYAAGRELYVGEIAHEPWTLRDATVERRANTLFAANGFERPDGEPIAHVADPIDVTADRIRPV
ncbi:YqjF family protein [Halorubrum pallidum]